MICENQQEINILVSYLDLQMPQVKWRKYSLSWSCLSLQIKNRSDKLICQKCSPKFGPKLLPEIVTKLLPLWKL